MFRPTAWACRTCNKVDWTSEDTALAKPEHVPHRGCDIGICRGTMIPLYGIEEVEHILRRILEELRNGF